MNRNELRSKILELQHVKAQINVLVELSPAGRERYQKDVDREAAALRPTALAALKSEWESLRRRHKETGQKLAASEEAEAARWDFQRLNYELASLRAKVRGGNWIEVEQLYSALENSGDKHKLRAFAENMDELLRGYDASQKMELVGRAKRALSELRTTPEIGSAKAELDALTVEARELDGLRVKLNEFYDPDRWALSSPSDFDQVSGLAEPTPMVQVLDDGATIVAGG